MKFILYTLIVFCFISCTPNLHYYDPALLHLDIAYQPKPMSVDSIKTAKYISIGFNQKEISNDSKEYDMVNSFQVDLSKAHTFKNLNISYGAFGMTGNLKNGTIKPNEPFYFDRKNFTALGIRGSANTYIKSSNIEYRFIGVEFSYSKEFGDFAAFRKAIYDEVSYYSVHNKELFTAGFTTEVLMHHVRNTNQKLGARLFIGKTFTKMLYAGPIYEGTYPESPKVANINIAAFGQLSRFFAVLEGGNTSSRVRFGYRF